MKLGYDKLSPIMLKVLKEILIGTSRKSSSRTIKALRWRGLIDSNNNLTEYGQVLALQGVSLKQQCKILGLPFSEIKTTTFNDPEKSFQIMLEKEGVQSFFVENTFGLFIDYIMGNSLITTAKQLGKTVFTLNPPFDAEIFFFLRKDLENHLERMDINHCQNVFSVCKPYLETIIMDETPTQVVMLFEKIFRSLGLNKVKAVLRMYFSNPLAYNYRGWPDLFVMENERAYFIEVKTTDKLHLNQLVTIPDMINIAGLTVEIVRLIH